MIFIVLTHTFLLTRVKVNYIYSVVATVVYSLQCPNKAFESWKKCRKHVNSLHTGKEFRCVECDRVFCRAEKLKQHSLIHSNTREYMCDTCGKQFNRKDKVHFCKDHVLVA